MQGHSPASITTLTLISSFYLSSSYAIELIFERDFAFGPGELISQNYGDRVTAEVMSDPSSNNDFLYSLYSGFTPGIEVSYTSSSGSAPRVWTTNYGDLENVLYVAGTLNTFEMQLVADAPTKVVLYSFDMAGWPQRNYRINSVEVLDENDNSLFYETDVLIEGASPNYHTSFTFDPPLSGTTLKIKFDPSNLEGNSANIGIDNIKFDSVPFATWSADYLGTAYARAGWDLQPTVMYDETDNIWKMWWFCEFDHKENPPLLDLARPYLYHVADRICYAEATDPNGPWSWPPRIVLSGRASDNEFDNGDDHLVGSPSVIKVSCAVANCPPGSPSQLFVMFYEAYGTWMTRVNSFSSLDGKDWFDTNGEGAAQNDTGGYIFNPEVELGFAPYTYKHGTRPVYSCQVIYPDGKVNRYLMRGADRYSPNPCKNGVDDHGTWSHLNFGWHKGERKSLPVFWTYNLFDYNRVFLRVCYDTNNRNTFVATDLNCRGVANADHVDDLGHVSWGWIENDDLAIDMRGVNQNRIHMAYSADGIHWTRFEGTTQDVERNTPRRISGAIIVPGDQYAMSKRTDCPDADGAERYSFHRTYGAGLPSALIRGEYVEVFFRDDTNPTTSNHIDKCITDPTIEQRIRVPLSQMFTASRWGSAAEWNVRGFYAQYGEDIKWSEDHDRYFALTLKDNKAEDNVDVDDENYQQWPVLVWSLPNPPTTGALSMDFNNPIQVFDQRFPTNWNNSNSGRWGRYGAIAGDHNGQVLRDPYGHGIIHDAFHVYYEANEAGRGNIHSDMDIDHILVIGSE